MVDAIHKCTYVETRDVRFLHAFQKLIDHEAGTRMQRYVTNPQAIHETIDGETIIIDLSTGTYFSLLGAAPTIWNALAAGATTGELIAAVEQAYATDAVDVGSDVESFLRMLEGDQLIATTSDDGAASAADSASGAAKRLPYVQPKLEKYTDMQDIIMLDPVHEVDSRGWPHAAEAQAS